jgi:hypothetical protein
VLEKKCFRWFNKEGRLLGSILSKDPIRRVYCSAEGMVVETCQHRAAIRRRTGVVESEPFGATAVRVGAI